MKPTGSPKHTGRLGYIRTVASALAVSTVIMGAGFSARTATINREKLPWETKRILSGIVSDSMCGKGHTINGRGDRDWTRSCVNLGADYALVVDRSLFILKGHEAELDEFAGQSVTVAGAVSHNTVKVEWVAAMAPLYMDPPQSVATVEVSKVNQRLE
jgi:hypothetical protein